MKIAKCPSWKALIAMSIDSLMLDVSQLRLKWAVEDVNRAMDKLIPLLEKFEDYETIEALASYAQSIAKYVETADRIRAELK